MWAPIVRPAGVCSRDGVGCYAPLMLDSSSYRCILAVDLGTSGAKVALVGLDGRVAGWEFAPVELIVLPGGGAEQRPDDWWRAVVAATRRLLARHDGPAAEVAAVCCSTQSAASSWAGPSRPSTWSAAEDSRTSGRRSSATCSA